MARSQQEVTRLKAERDRLVEISNELRAQLNKSKQTVSEYKGLLRKATNSLETDVDPVQASGKRSSAKKFMDHDPLHFDALDDDLNQQKHNLNLNDLRKIQVQQQTKLDSIGNVVKDLAVQMREFIQDKMNDRADMAHDYATNRPKSKPRDNQSEGRGLK